MERQSTGVEVLVWKYHVFTFLMACDGPRKHVDLLEQLLDVSNNPAIRAEDNPGTARSKQTTKPRK